MQAAVAETVKLAVRDAKDDDVTEVASLLPPRQAEAMERPGLTAQQRIWHVIYVFKERCKLLERCAWVQPGKVPVLQRARVRHGGPHSGCSLPRCSLLRCSLIAVCWGAASVCAAWVWPELSCPC